MRTTRLIVLAAITAALVSSGAEARPSASTSAADVRRLAQAVEDVHPAPFRSVTPARFRAETRALAQRAPMLTRNELLVGMLRLVALLGPRNGHTGIFPGDPAHTPPLHLYPLRLYHFSDGLFVVDARDRSLVGSRVVALAGVPMERVLETVAPLVPRDNASNLRGMAPHFALTAEILEGLGLVERSDGAAGFTLETTDGARVDVPLAPVSSGEYVALFSDSHHGHYPSALPRAAKPLYLAGSARPLWARPLARGRAVYIGFNSVVPPSPAALRRIGRLVRSPAVRRAIVDVRLNGGGDNTTYGPLLGLLDAETVDRRGKLSLLVGRATFSAAANFAAEVDRQTRAVVLGEPTGGGVETYGDTVTVPLPDTGFQAHVAARYHDRRRGPRDRRLAVEPDVAVPLSSADYFAGRDPVLERALRGL